MLFLNPWLWLGALALAAPLWLHLRRKQETHLVRFSALRFLEDAPAPRRSPLQLRRRALLALRALALLLIVAAFCWPYFTGADVASVRESRVYILDNTLSHQANEGFTRDRARVLDELGRSGRDVQIGVIELTTSPRVVVGFGDDRSVARQKLAALEPSFGRGSYLAAFRQAQGMLAGSLGRRKRIVFLGDDQENQWSENVHTPPFLEDVQVEWPTPGARELPNVSLAEPRLERVFLGDKSIVNLTLTLSHSGPARTAQVTVKTNGHPIFNRTVELERQPPTILLQAQWEADTGSWVRGEAVVQAEPDALAGDNRLFFCLAPVVEGKVALLAQSPYLRLALSPEVMRGQWAARGLDPAKLDAELAGNQDADVLCIESGYLQSGDARKLVSRYLSNGRGVLLLVNRLTPTIEGCLRELGFEAEGAVQRPQEHPERFQFILSNHAIFHPFLAPDYGNLMDLKVLQYVKLRPTAATPLVFSESGAGLFFQGTKFPGKLFVTAFGLDRAQSSWPIHQTFIPFLDLALQAARAEDPAPTLFEPGQATTLMLPAGWSAHAAVLRQGGREVARAPVEQGRARLRMPAQPGLYALTSDQDNRLVKIFSVNPSPKESQLRFHEPSAVLRAWRLEHSNPVPTPTGVRGQVRLASVLRQRVWWWMLLGGLMGLFVEMMWVTARKESV